MKEKNWCKICCWNVVEIKSIRLEQKSYHNREKEAYEDQT